MTAPLATPDLLPRFQALTTFLREHRALWQPKPFTHLRLPWETQHAELADWLRRRTLEQAEAAHNHPERLKAPAPFPALASEAMRLAEVGALPHQPLPPVAPRMSVDVPGRKWQQIEAFAGSLAFSRMPRHWLDWCAGKGHLGRRLAHHGQSLTCLEHDPQLVDAGRQLSTRLNVDAQHLEQDVMAPSTAKRLTAEHTPVALHACGDLHVRLMQLASDTGCEQLAVAPCCYNRIAGDHYHPLSRAAQQAGLPLSIDNLGLPLSETVTAGARVRRQRDTSMARRLAFDLLQRQLRGTDHYLPTPSLPSAWLDRPFRDYIQHLAQLKGVPLSETLDWNALETAGWQRLAEVRNLELPRNLFRRPLELWLNLDKALYLAERGYHVRLGTFCDTYTTPRNLLILAEQP